MNTPNPDQLGAIEAPLDRPVRIVAGAGTGKTEVISRRYVHLLVREGLRPEQILTLTFSEKAAAEMRARIFRAVTSAGFSYRRLDLAGAPISTFHAFGARLMREYSLFAGVEPSAPLLTDANAEDILRSGVHAFLEGEYEALYPFNPIEKEVYTWEDGGPVYVARALIDQMRNQGMDAHAFSRHVRDMADQSERHAVLAPFVGFLYAFYERALIRRGQADFDRLITGVVELLEKRREIRDRIRRVYRAILVDEYQDTNYAQERLLRAISQEGMKNVTVVGDPRQAIYIWREARVENMAGFPGTAGERVERPLSQNWRSLSPILAVANRSIQGYVFSDPPEFDPLRRLETARPSGFSGPVVTLETFDGREAEAEGVAAWITRLHEQGRPYSDMAMLIRARTYLTVYLDALTRHGVPLELSAGDAFYLRPEILQTIHLLRFCVDPTDDLALAVTLLGPVGGLSQKEMVILRDRDDESLWRTVTELVEETPDHPLTGRLTTVAELWKEACRQRWLRSSSSFVAWLLQASGLAGASGPEAARALHKLMAVIHAYESEHPDDTIEALTDHLRTLVQTGPAEKSPELSVDSDAVKVMTAHASKGLEFPVTLVVDNRQKLTPYLRKAPFHEPDIGLIFPEEDEKNPCYLNRTRNLRNEARCLWYVTLTRAKERMIVTAGDADALDEEGFYNPPKTFFQELWNEEAQSPSEGVERRFSGRL